MRSRMSCSERGSSVGRYEPIPTIPEDALLADPEPLPPPLPANNTAHPRLAFVDFWPKPDNPDATFNLIQFDRFDTLLPLANSWLREHPHIDIVKCETIERKVWSLDQLRDDYSSAKFDVPTNIDVVFYLKGLRVWWRAPRGTNRRSRSQSYQIGYRNAMPRCLDVLHRSPVYEDLGAMYATLNEHLIERPLEGPIITMETVTVRLDRLHWEGPVIEVDRTHWPMTPKQHTFFFTRIFYLFQCPAYEQVGAADFLPDLMNEAHQKAGLPRCTGVPFVLKKFNAWLKQVKDIRVTNIQSLEAAYPGKTEKVQTNLNFINKSDTMHMIRFIRVTYARPKFGLPPGGLHIPRLLSQKSFLPEVLHINEKDGTAELEDINTMGCRIRAWLKNVGNHIINAEVLYHPLPLVVNRRDAGETTVLPGEWLPAMTDTISNRKQSLLPAKQVLMVRIYMEGEFIEPDPEVLKETIRTLPPSTDQLECCKLL